MDEDLQSKTKEELISEAILLRNAIRKHRDAQGHDLCWYHPELWDLLPETNGVERKIPEWCDFISNCAAYRRSLDNEEATGVQNIVLHIKKEVLFDEDDDEFVVEKFYVTFTENSVPLTSYLTSSSLEFALTEARNILGIDESQKIEIKKHENI